MNKQTKIINLFAGPGSGKSTMAAMIFSKLKMLGKDCELITEFAKKLTWHKRFNSLTCQPYVFGKQLHEIYNVYGQVDYIITDSPILLSAMYTSDRWPKSFVQSVLEIFNSFNNINIFVRRVKEYNPNGRNQTEQEAKLIDNKLMDYLLNNSIKFNILPGTEESVNEIVRRLTNE